MEPQYGQDPGNNEETLTSVREIIRKSVELFPQGRSIPLWIVFCNHSMYDVTSNVNYKRALIGSETNGKNGIEKILVVGGSD